MSSRVSGALRILGDMCILDLLAVFPASAEIMAEYGLHCSSCVYGGRETLREGCAAHSFPPALTRELMDDINRALAREPRRTVPPMMTTSARRAIRALARKEGLSFSGLAVLTDGHGGFCMELSSKPKRGQVVVHSRGGKGPLSFFLEPIILQRVSGATVDYRGGRFQLDFPHSNGSRFFA